MKTAILARAVCAVFALLPTIGSAAPTITIYTDADTYQSGDTIEVSLSAENDGEGMSVAVYVGLLTQDRGIYTTQFDGWTASLEPWIPDTYVTSGFTMAPTPFWWFDLPCSMPPIEEPGDYSFAAVLTYPGTFEWVSIASLAPFTVLASVGSHYHVDCGTGDDSNDGSFGSPWKTITHALASVEGSETDPVTLHVAAGTYSASTNGESFPLNMKSWVSLSGEDRETTILDAEKAVYHVIYCKETDNLRVEDFTITGGAAFGKANDFYGGGIFCSGSSPTFSDNVITDNTGYAGGGIYCEEGSPTILNCTIESNAAQYEGLGGSMGGGIYCGFYCSAIISGNTIRANSADSGGGLICAQITPLITGNTISENLGGGIFCVYGGGPMIVGNTIVGNVGDSGGGIECSGGSPMIKDNVITDNKSEGQYYTWPFSAGGGGIVCFQSNATVSGNLIAGNSAVRNGGGMYCLLGGHPIIGNNLIFGNEASSGGGIKCSESSPDIFSSTVVGNSASMGLFGGGGISGDWLSKPPTIFDCIIWANGDDLSDCSATFCCIEDLDAGEGNIHDAPMFVTGPFGEYYLNPESPCIDAGSQSTEQAGLADRTTQADGTPDTGIVDMGYHYAIP